MKILSSDEVRKIFREKVKSQLFTYDNRLVINKSFMGVANITFFIQFNPEEWNFFPSMKVNVNSEAIWISEYSPYFDETNPQFPSKGGRMYYNGTGYVTNLDGEGNPDEIDQAIKHGKELIEDLKLMIDELTDLNDLYDKWFELCKKHNFGK